MATGVEKTIRFSVGFITLQISYGENVVLSDCRLAVAAAVSGLKLILIVYLSFDIIILPKKNAYVNQKWPKTNAIPYVIDSAFGKASHFSLIFILFYEFKFVFVFESDAKARCAIGYAVTKYHKNTCIRFVPQTVQSDYIKINKFDTTEYVYAFA